MSRMARPVSGVFDTLRSVVVILRARPLRTVLMMSGSLVGALAVVAILGLAQASQTEIERQIDELGGSLVILSVSGSGRDDAGAGAAMERIRELPQLAAATTYSVSDYVVGNNELDDVQLEGIGSLVMWSPSLAETFGLTMAWGGDLRASDVELRADVAVVGSEIGRGLGESRVIVLNGNRYRVVGMLDSYAPFPAIDTSVIIPAPGPLRELGRFSDRSSVLRATSVDAAPLLGRQARELARLSKPTAQVQVSYARDLVTVSTAITPVVRWSAYGVGALAVVLGSSAILNVLLMSVNERRREVGLRLALGHPHWHVGALFLTEGLLVGLIGAMVGVAAGAAVIWVATAVLQGWAYAYPWLPALAIVALAGLLSLFAAAVPARIAMRVDPASSLRLE